jgi:hypothetical protein
MLHWCLTDLVLISLEQSVRMPSNITNPSILHFCAIPAVRPVYISPQLSDDGHGKTFSNNPKLFHQRETRSAVGFLFYLWKNATFGLHNKFIMILLIILKMQCSKSREITSLQLSHARMAYNHHLNIIL